ncbi:MAG: hypothetical protein U5Q44_11245 [Dehalococcoidia bacterium]|nr:hypothetical protein [Dehalococcoidia bacterium]
MTVDQDPGDYDQSSAGQRWDGYLSPCVWLPVGGILVILSVILAVLLVMNWDDGAYDVVIQQCDPEDPDCALRQTVHWHADLAIVINGESIDFGQEQFISTEDDPLAESSHIHDPRHSVVHVHLEQTTWREFLSTLGFQLGDNILTTPDGEEYVEGEGGEWHYIVNGVAIDSLQQQYIGDLDRVLMVFGDLSEEEALAMWSEAVSDEACISSGLCSDRFPPGGIEDEPCSVGSLTCN